MYIVLYAVHKVRMEIFLPLFIFIAYFVYVDIAYEFVYTPCCLL